MVFDFPRDEVLSSIRSNRDRHRDELNEALSGWREEFADALDVEIARLGRLRKRARAGTLRPKELRHDELGVRSPESHEDDYEVAIRMLEMASTDVVTLPEADFARYVLDRWDWRDRFDDYMTAMRYKRSRGSARHTRRA